MKDQERRYRAARVGKENWDVREQASTSPSRSSYDAGAVGLQPRPWCQVLERALGVAPEDCLFAVGPTTIYAVVADTRRLVLRRLTPQRVAEAKEEIARLGASSRSVVLRGVSRRLFDAASAAQRMGGDPAALEFLGYRYLHPYGGDLAWPTKRSRTRSGPTR